MKPYDIRRKMEMTRRYAAASATRQEKDSAISRAHEYVMLGYTLMNAADILFRRTEDIMSVVDSSYRYDDRFRIRESLKALRAVIGRGLTAVTAGKAEQRKAERTGERAEQKAFFHQRVSLSRPFSGSA